MVNARASGTYDDKRTCRSCLSKSDELIALDKPFNQIAKADREFIDSRETVANVMMTCANIQIEFDDGLPQNVCTKCVADIRAAFAYRQMCERSDADLRKIFQLHLSNVSVKLERLDGMKIADDAEMHPSDEHWFEEFEADLKTEDVTEVEETILAFNYDSSPAHSFEEEIARDDDELDIFQEYGETGADAKKKFACEICSKSFSRSYNLKQHSLVHTSKKNFVCNICNQEYKSHSNLKRHIRSHLEHNKTCKNDGAGKQLNARIKKTKSIQSNSSNGQCENASPEKKHVCDICAKAFTRTYNLNQHKLEHIGAKSTFACGVCKREYKTRSSATSCRHLKERKRSDEKRNKIVLIETKENSVDHSIPFIGNHEGTPSVKRYVCEICSKVFNRNFNLKQHRLIHTGKKNFSCDICTREFMKKSELKRHLEKHMDKSETSDALSVVTKKMKGDTIHSRDRHIRSSHQPRKKVNPPKIRACEICSKVFTRTYNLNQHMLVHTGEKQYSCDMCKREYKSKRNLKYHIFRHILQKKRAEEDAKRQLDGGTNDNDEFKKPRKNKAKPKTEYVCEVCAKPFKHLNNFHQHRLVHTDVRNFACDICQRSFKTKAHLKNHMRTHSEGDKIYSHLCSICGNRYQNLTRLTEHMRHHTGEKPFECEICHKAFHKFYNLTTHRRTHELIKPFNCTICGRGFVIKDKLRVHMMLHTGERPFKCTVCDAGFRQPCLLKVHMRTHTGEMPYLCGICGVRYQHRAQMLKHRRLFDHFETTNKNETETNSQVQVKPEVSVH